MKSNSAFTWAIFQGQLRGPAVFSRAPSLERENRQQRHAVRKPDRHISGSIPPAHSGDAPPRPHSRRPQVTRVDGYLGAAILSGKMYAPGASGNVPDSVRAEMRPLRCTLIGYSMMCPTIELTAGLSSANSAQLRWACLTTCMHAHHALSHTRVCSGAANETAAPASRLQQVLLRANGQLQLTNYTSSGRCMAEHRGMLQRSATESGGSSGNVAEGCAHAARKPASAGPGRSRNTC